MTSLAWHTSIFCGAINEYLQEGLIMFCINCGAQIEKDQKFCGICGMNLQEEMDTLFEEVSSATEEPSSSFQAQVKGTFLQATEKVNQLVGEEGSIDVNLIDVFSDVFKKHTKEEGEQLFISGTKKTTPKEIDISTTWPKPWFFSRVFFILAITFTFLYICTDVFQNVNAVPGLIIIGSFAVPFSLLILFWEMNAPRNISFYEVAQMFFVGGAASLVATLILYSIFPVLALDFSGAIIVGVVEEVGKLAIIIHFIRKINPKYILNGLLIGATIGAGFAAFESAGYAYSFGMMYGEDTMMSIIFMRGWMSIGTHVVWSAIAGAALVRVKGEHPLTSNHIFHKYFLKLFSVSIILHAVWDMPLYFLHNFYFLFIVLIIIAWIFIFSFINTGLKQIIRLNQG